MKICSRKKGYMMDLQTKKGRRLSISIGNCGEYFVAAELERRGFSVAIPMSNTPNFDILAINRQTYKQYAIQVKTTSYGANKWFVNDKVQGLEENSNMFYVFVHLHELETPTYYIIPRKQIVKYLNDKYEDKNVSKNTYMLIIKNDEFSEYKNNWDIIKNC